MIDKPIVVIDFDGPGGNTLAIVGACRRVARSADWPKATIEAFTRELMCCDREHAMNVLFECFDVHVPVASVAVVDRSCIQ